MIKLQNYTPEVYYKQSRDFQYLGRLFDIVLNSSKTNADIIYDIPSSEAAGSELIDLLALTLGFKAIHTYNIKQLIAVCSVLPKILKNKGTRAAITLVCQAVLTAEGILASYDVSVDKTTNNIEIILPTTLTDINLVQDLLYYILPAGMTYTISKTNLTNYSAKTIISADASVKVYPIGSAIDEATVSYLPPVETLAASIYDIVTNNTNDRAHPGFITNMTAINSPLLAYKSEHPDDPSVVYYTVSFDANGGTGSMPSMYIESGSSYTIPASTFVAPTNYTFGGWQINGQPYSPGDSIIVTTNTVIVAIWNERIINRYIVENGNVDTETALRQQYEVKVWKDNDWATPSDSNINVYLENQVNRGYTTNNCAKLQYKDNYYDYRFGKTLALTNNYDTINISAKGNGICNVKLRLGITQDRTIGDISLKGVYMTYDVRTLPADWYKYTVDIDDPNWKIAYGNQELSPSQICEYFHISSLADIIQYFDTAWFLIKGYREGGYSNSIYIDDFMFTDEGGATSAQQIIRQTTPTVAIVEDGNEADNTALRNEYTVEYYGNSGWTPSTSADVTLEDIVGDDPDNTKAVKLKYFLNSVNFRFGKHLELLGPYNTIGIAVKGDDTGTVKLRLSVTNPNIKVGSMSLAGAYMTYSLNIPTSEWTIHNISIDDSNWVVTLNNQNLNPATVIAYLNSQGISISSLADLVIYFDKIYFHLNGSDNNRTSNILIDDVVFKNNN